METSGAKGHSKMDLTGFCSHKNIKKGEYKLLVDHSELSK